MWNGKSTSNSQNNCSNVTSQEIFAKLLGNFNTYEVLEPVKCDPTSKTNMQKKEHNLVDTDNNLIDIDTDEQTHRNNNETDAYLNTLLSDKEKFTYIDLFQNIYVTPKHLTKEAKKEKVGTSQINDISDIDYVEFARKLPLEHKFNDIKNDPEMSNVPQPLQQQYEPKVFESQIESPVNFQSKETFADEYVAVDPEDLFQEILAAKNFNRPLRTTSDNSDKTKLPINKLETQNRHNFENYAIPKIAPEESLSGYFTDTNYKTKLPINKLETQNTYDFENQIIPKVTTKEPLSENFAKSSDKPKLPLDKTDFRNLTIPKLDIPKNIEHLPFRNLTIPKLDIPKNIEHLPGYVADKVIPNTASTSDIDRRIYKSTGFRLNPLLYDFKSKDNAGSMKKFEDFPDCVSNINTGPVDNFNGLEPVCSSASNKKPNTKNDSNITNKVPLNTNAELIIAVKKDDKQYARNRLVKSDLEKKYFTKGPSLYEKSIVLPQILERLTLKRKELAERKDVKKRLQLGTEIKVRQDKVLTPPVELKPVMLMEDCNKERLKALEERQKIRSFVMGNQMK